MPKDAVAATPGYASGAAVPMPPQKLRINVQEVDNGFVVNLGHKIGYGDHSKIATTVEEVISIIRDYIESK